MVIVRLRNVPPRSAVVVGVHQRDDAPVLRDEIDVMERVPFLCSAVVVVVTRHVEARVDRNRAVDIAPIAHRLRADQLGKCTHLLDDVVRRGTGGPEQMREVPRQPEVLTVIIDEVERVVVTPRPPMHIGVRARVPRGLAQPLEARDDGAARIRWNAKGFRGHRSSSRLCPAIDERNGCLHELCSRSYRSCVR